MKVGDLVMVETKHGGGKMGTIMRPWGAALGNKAWVVWIPDHTCKRTIASECDLKLVTQ